MEKFALLNLIKAIDGLSGAEKTASADGERENSSAPAEQNIQGNTEQLPNFMYEALLRHEAVSNRIHNRKN